MRFPFFNANTSNSKHSQLVDKAVHIVESFAHFVRTALTVVASVPIVGIVLLSLDLVVSTVDIDQMSSVVNVGHWNTVDNS